MSPLKAHSSSAMHVVNAASIATMAEELWAFNGDMQPLRSLPAELPVSVLFGREDRIIGPRWHLDWLHERHPAARVELLDGIGHMPHHVASDLAVTMLGDLAGKVAPVSALALCRDVTPVDECRQSVGATPYG